MLSRIVTAALLCLCLSSGMSVAIAPAQAEDIRSLTKVSGDVYRARSNHHYSLVVVTGEGVVVVDPINLVASTWLRENVKKITDKPITHLIYSHSHGDHASGGAALRAGTVIAHANAPAEIDGVSPTKRFDETMNLNVGGKTFELTYLGKGHGTDLIAVVVRPENVAFIVDVAAPKRMPYRNFPRSDIDGWIDQIRKVESLNFDIFAPAHGAIGGKADAKAARMYMLELRGQVLAGLKAGKSVDDLARDVTMAKYSDWQQYKAWRELNVRGMAGYLMASGKVN